MRHFSQFVAVLFALATMLSASATFAYDRELDGPFALGEATYTSLPQVYQMGDFMATGRLSVGYTINPGFQFGGGVGYHYVDKSSWCFMRPVAELDECFANGEDESRFWDANLLAGYNLELSTGLLGVEMTLQPALPLTVGASGWSIESGAALYLSLESVTRGVLPLSFMAGIKYSYSQIELRNTPSLGDGALVVDGTDPYEIEGGRIIPMAGAMLQF